MSHATRVYVRTHRAPCVQWVARVRYDPWGAPYIGGGFWDTFLPYPAMFTRVLRPDGRTDDHLYGAEWKHVSGPSVTFGKSS